MPHILLQLRDAARPVREAAAWFLPGEDAARWLAEIGDWGIPQTDLRWAAVPRSPSDRRPAGVLVLAQDQQRLAKAEAGPACHAYGCIAGRLYLPIEARIEPEIAESELAALLADGRVYVWHPTAGLIGLDALAPLAELVQAAAPRPADWTRAQPGLALNRRLVAIVPAEPPTPETVMQAGRDDIGDSSSQLKELGPAPGEPANDLASQVGSAFTQGAARTMKWLSETFGGGRGGLLDGLHRWAEQSLRGFSQQLDAERNKEINRLLHLLESDPDQGLKYALPFHSESPRGMAPPGNRLARRDVEFRLGGLGGGGPADIWNLGADYQERLIRRYRELANRELQLGRHRRAAYIFAHLLGDFHAAASALRGGRFWREAAVIYRERLQQPHVAAACLEEGARWPEAIDLYTELEVFEKAGDLLARLGQQEEAREMYRRELETLRKKGDRLTAARLLEGKLNDADAAVTELVAAYPDSHQARDCVRALFPLWARLGRHGDAKTFVLRLGECAPARIFTDLPAFAAETLSRQAREYPDQGVQTAAAGQTRRVVSEMLPLLIPTDAEPFLAALRALEPGDRLLGRDCQRYLDQRRRTKPKERKAAPPSRSPQRQLAFELPQGQLPGGSVPILWQNAVVCGDAIFAAGIGGDRIWVARCNWQGMAQTPVPFPDSRWNEETEILLAPFPRQRHVFVGAQGIANPPLALQLLPRTDQFSERITVGSMRGASSQILAVAEAGQGAVFLGPHPSLAVSVYDFDAAAIRSTQAIALDLVGNLPSSMHVSLVERNGKIAVGHEQELILLERNGERRIELPRRVVRLCASPLHTRGRIGIGLTMGAGVLWTDGHPDHPVLVADDLAEPAVCINRGGWFIAAGSGVCEIYGTSDSRLVLDSRIAHIGREIVAVLPGPAADEFALLSAGGRVEVFTVRPR